MKPSLRQHIQRVLTARPPSTDLPSFLVAPPPYFDTRATSPSRALPLVQQYANDIRSLISGPCHDPTDWGS
jgi:hypothetical protein